jgi:FtsH-binding integral membrane protein
MRKVNNKVFLYGGLTLLFTAFAIRWVRPDISLVYFGVLLGMAITLKSIFLITNFRKKGFKPALWHYFILAGVIMILLSLLFKQVYPIPPVQLTLFYGAILLKVSGLILLLTQKK